MSRACLLLVLCVTILTSVGCSRAPTMDSRWRQKAIAVDGADDDWPQSRYVLEGMIPVTVGVLNDTSHIYLCVVTADRALQRRVLFSGLEVWLDPQGGTRHHVGLRLPGLDRATLPSAPDRAGAADPRGTMRRGARRGASEAFDKEMSAEHLASLFSVWEAQSELRLVDSESDEGTRLQPSVQDPLQLRAHFDQGRLVVEARLPLASHGYPTYAVPAGGPLGVALRIPSPPVPPHRDEFRPGVGRSGSSATGMEGATRPGGDTRAGRQTSIAEPLQQWARIVLRSAP